MRRAVSTTLILAAACLPPLVSISRAPAATVSQTAAQTSAYGGSAAGNAALDWAEAHALNAPYEWGGTGPGYDCSGIVEVAFSHAGVSLPRSTYAMVRSGRLHRVWFPQRGDLAFWGSISAPYHTEFVTAWNRTGFGAETYGWAGRVTWHSWVWFAPSAYYRVY